jgi:hypothetical protein
VGKRIFQIGFLPAVLLGLFLGSLPAQQPAPQQFHPRGRKPAPPAIRAAIFDANMARHGEIVKTLPMATQRQFDCREAFKNVLPTDNQGNCGDCYGVSSADACSMALIKAGILPLDGTKGRLSSQYGLDNRLAFKGGCEGGNESQVIDYIHKNGFPLTSEYGPYTAQPHRPRPVSGMKLFRIDDWGYCTPSQQEGVAATQDMKNCMAEFGPISVAFDASGCDRYRWPQVMSGRGANVDHAVLCIGWDDDKGAFLGMNQWGDSWGGPNCTFWIRYGSYSWGTDAIWVKSEPVNPPPPPPPPPGPTPEPCKCHVHFLTGGGVVVLVVGLGFVLVWLLKWRKKP